MATTPSDRPDPLHMLDLCQTGAARVIAEIPADRLGDPTPCDEWTVGDIVNKLTASTLVFTSFGLREQPDAALDLIHPTDIIGDDPVGAYSVAAAGCREAWHRPGATEGMALSTIGEAKARAVLNARIFDTTILTWDLATACGVPHLINDALATYVLRIAQALVPAVRSQSHERYKEPVDLGDGADPVDRLIAATGRDPGWTPPA